MTRGLPLDDSLRARLHQDGLEFLADFYGRAHRRHPEDLEVLTELGHLLTRLGRFEEGLGVDQRLVRAMPEHPIVHYNHACSLALADRPLEALDALERAVELGYDDPEHLQQDEDLASLRTAPRFERILRRLHAAAS